MTPEPGPGSPIAQAHILVAGLAKDCGASLRDEVSRLRAALDGFGTVSWLVVESDSTDDTVGILRVLSETIPNFRYLTLGRLRDELPMRTERIAFCRDRYLDELRGNALYRDVRYLAVVDLDGMNNLLSREAVLTCWSRTDWDGCTANQAGPYYDIWALRHRDWSPNDYFRQTLFLQRYGKTVREADQASVWARMITIPPTSEWIEVESSFGGLALYRRDAIPASARYVGLTPEGEGVCEHIAFHEQIRAHGGRLFINPGLINAGWTEHSRIAYRSAVGGRVGSLAARISGRAGR